MSYYFNKITDLIRTKVTVENGPSEQPKNSKLNTIEYSDYTGRNTGNEIQITPDSKIKSLDDTNIIMNLEQIENLPLLRDNSVSSKQTTSVNNNSFNTNNILEIVQKEFNVYNIFN